LNAVIKLSSPATSEFWEIPVLHEDEHLLALDKPAGLLASPDRTDGSRPDPEPPELMKLLHAGIAAGKPWAVARGLTYLNHAHWLDGETSGVLLLAKSKPVLVALADLFSAEKPVRKFVALVHGSPKDERFEVNAKLGAHPLKPGMMRVDPQNGKKAKTIFEVLERFADTTLLRCQPVTDRTHQIRVHLQNSGLRIAGDALYGGAPLLLSRLKREYRLKPGRVERPLIARVALHAEQLEFPHPIIGETLAIASPLPKDLRVALKYLRLYAGT
jgi:RluA family pseudouridine synthase